MRARLVGLSGLHSPARHDAEIRWVFQWLKEMFPAFVLECECENNVVCLWLMEGPLLDTELMHQGLLLL